MRKIFLLLIATALILTAAWFLARRPGAEIAAGSSQVAPDGAASSRHMSDGAEPVAKSNALPVGRITEDRKRSIVQAAFACRRADSFRNSARALAGASSADPESSLSPVQRENLSKADAECSADPAARSAPLEDFLLDLARSGNIAAATCYVSGALRSQTNTTPPPNVARYQQVVPQLIAKGIAAGDWNMVSLAASINGTRRAGSPFIYLPPADPKKELLYTKLLALGATAEQKADLQSIVEEIGRPLSPADRKSAEASAERLYQAHFAQSGPYIHGRQPLCRDF